MEKLFFNQGVKKALLLCMLASAMLSTGSHAAANVWTGWYPINQVQLHQTTGAIFIELDPREANSNPANCRSAAWIRVRSNDTTKMALQMLLTAQASGMKVNLHIDGAACAGSYPSLLLLKTAN